jgi:hypothetical protein
VAKPTYPSLVKYWSNAGQMLVKYWSNPGGQAKLFSLAGRFPLV